MASLTQLPFLTSICGSVLPQRKHADSAQHPLSSDAGDASILCLVGRPDLETGIEGTVHIRGEFSESRRASKGLAQGGSSVNTSQKLQ